jgi:hypothetical protein
MFRIPIACITSVSNHNPWGNSLRNARFIWFVSLAVAEAADAIALRFPATVGAR